MESTLLLTADHDHVEGIYYSSGQAHLLSFYTLIVPESYVVIGNSLSHPIIISGPQSEQKEKDIGQQAW